jgi:hypothetical protein
MRRDPHAILALTVAAILLGELGRHEFPTEAWLFVVGECCVALAALVATALSQDRIRLGPLLIIAFLLQAGWLGLALGAFSFTHPTDSLVVYRTEGAALLAGNYPHSEYPPGAVLLFALEYSLGRGATLVSNALLMVPFQLLCVSAVWLLRTRNSAWFAALLAIWPANAFCWTFRFDLVPTALLLLGLLLAWRERWALSGVALGVGAAVKWTPGISAVAIAGWLLASRRPRLALRHAAAAVAAGLVVYLPFIVWAPSAVEAAYRRQTGRGITAESIYYLPLKAAGFAKLPAHLWYSAHAPNWANDAAIVFQGACVAAVIVFATTRRSPAAALALAALAPAVFLLTNRIFSPQFLITIFAALTAAAALAGFRTRAATVSFGAVISIAALANALVFPFTPADYHVTRRLAMAMSFGLLLLACAWLLRRAGVAERLRTDRAA